jgi:antitoxin CptB
MNFEIDKFKKKLIYRSQYRGTKEMDKLIGTFVKKYINNLTNSELVELENFLEIDDDVLYKFYNNEKTEFNIKESKITNLFKNFVYK